MIVTLTNITIGGTVVLPPAVLWQGLPFQVIRQPRKTAAAPLQLPLTAVVDLAASGTNSAPLLLAPLSDTDTSPVMIMFSSNGAVDRIYVQQTGIRVTEPIFLLIGKRERVPDVLGGAALVDEETGLPMYNWQDLKNLWVTVNPQTGLVTSTENAFVDPTETNPLIGIPIARAYAREGRSMGGR